MDTLMFLLTRALLVLFAIGVLGCLIVIPATAVQLFKVLFQPDTAEETAGNTQKLRTVS